MLVAPVPITGDLEGTFTPTFVGETRFAGATQANGGPRYGTPRVEYVGR